MAKEVALGSSVAKEVKPLSISIFKCPHHCACLNNQDESASGGHTKSLLTNPILVPRFGHNIGLLPYSIEISVSNQIKKTKFYGQLATALLHRLQLISLFICVAPSIVVTSHKSQVFYCQMHRMTQGQTGH